MTDLEIQKLVSALTAKTSQKKTAALDDAKRAKMNAEFSSLLEKGDFGRKTAASYFNEALLLKVPYVSITPKLLDPDNIGKDVAWADLEFPELGASVVPFKGAPAYIERGPKRIMFLTHTDAQNWSVFYDQMMVATYDQLNHAKDKVATALAISVDTDLFKQLEAISSTSIYPSKVVAAMSPSVINSIRGEMAAFDLFTENIVLHSSKYYDMLNVTAQTVDQVTLNSIIETGFIGNFYGVNFIVSKLCPKNAGYALANKKYVGKFVLRQAQTLKIADLSYKLKYVVTGYINYGICLYNPPAVRKFTFNA